MEVTIAGITDCTGDRIFDLKEVTTATLAKLAINSP
jgi:hypothetical protein